MAMLSRLRKYSKDFILKVFFFQERKFTMQWVKRKFFGGTMNFAKKPLKQLTEINFLIKKRSNVGIFIHLIRAVLWKNNSSFWKQMRISWRNSLHSTPFGKTGILCFKPLKAVIKSYSTTTQPFKNYLLFFSLSLKMSIR